MTSDTDLTSCAVSLGDVVASTRRGGEVRMLLSPATVGATSGLTGHLVLDPGDAISEHYHPYSEEHVYVVAGDVEMSLDGSSVALGPGAALSVPTGVRHRLVNVGATRAEVVFHLSPLAPEPRLGHVDTEALPEPGAPGPLVAR